MITSIIYIDYNIMSPSNVTIVEGGIEERFVKIKIKTAPGMVMKSIIGIQYKETDTIFSPMIIKDFFETQFDVYLEDF